MKLAVASQFRDINLIEKELRTLNQKIEHLSLADIIQSVDDWL